MRQTSIYLLRDPANNRIRYVGKTIQTPAARLTRHLSDARLGIDQTYRTRWIASLLRSGVLPIMEVIELCGENWAEREAYWISFYRLAGKNLTNVTDGGEGMPGCKLSAAECARRSARMKSEMRDPVRRAKIGSATSRRQKAKAAIDAEYRQQIIARTHTPESRARQAESIAAYARTEEGRKKFASHFSVVVASKEWRAWQSDRMTKLSNSPERRAERDAYWNEENRKVQAERTRNQWTPERKAAASIRAREQRHREMEANFSLEAQ